MNPKIGDAEAKIKACKDEIASLRVYKHRDQQLSYLVPHCTHITSHVFLISSRFSIID
jgi:hypothetical protein